MLPQKKNPRLFSPPPSSCRQQQKLWFDCPSPVTDGNDRAEQTPFCQIKQNVTIVKSTATQSVK